MGAQAATCTVSSTGDTDTSGTLRYCLNHLASGSAAGTNTIDFSVTGTITLTSTLPDIENGVTITGPGASQLTISGAGKYQIMTIGLDAGDPSVSLSGLTFANADNAPTSGEGGAIAILNSGTVTVTGCTFSGNTVVYGWGGAIFDAGDSTLTVTDSIFLNNLAQKNNGGAIVEYNGTMVVEGSFFSGNSSAASTGGALEIESTATIVNNTFVGNSGRGAGAIDVNNAPNAATIANNTFVGNSASVSGQGVIDVETGTLTASNNLFVNNSAPDAIQNSATANASYNVFYNNAGADCDGCTSNSNATDASSNPLTLPLGYYGGTTETYLPQPGSPAICAGSAGLASAAGLSTDQRGFTLTSAFCANGGVDAGAVQTNYIEVQSSGGSVSAGSIFDCPGIRCTLADAILIANSAASPTVYGDIDFASGVSSITQAAGLTLSSTYGVNIIGPGANQLTVNGGGSSSNFSVFTVNSGVPAFFSGLTIANGNSTFGGAIDNSGTLTVNQSALSGNVGDDGGAIYNSGTAYLEDSTVSGNTASETGGAIFNAGTAQIQESTISGNSLSSDAVGYGGGIASTGTLTITGSTIAGNAETDLTGDGGGGVVNSGGTLTLANSIVAGNTAAAGYFSNIEGSYTNEGGNAVGGNTDASSSLVNGLGPAVITLSPLQLNGIGATLQTMIPLPGSAAICAGATANIPSGTTTDERGYPLQPSGGYCASGTLDAGAVQTNYTGVEWVQEPPASTYANADISPAPTVEVLETDTLLGSNNTDAVNGVPVTIAFNGPGALNGTLTETTSGGVATYANLSPTDAAMGDSLETEAIPVTSGFTLPAQTSSSFDAIGDVSQLIVSAPSAATAGTAFNVTVTAEDAAGNTVTNFSGLVMISSTDGTITDPIEVLLSSGVATFAATLHLAGSQTIIATEIIAPNYSGVSGAIAVSAGPATQLAASAGTPQSAYVDGPFAAPLTVVLVDAYGNAVSGAMVNFTAPSSGASATLSAASCTTAANGSCSVTAKANGTAGGPYNVTASYSSLSVSFALTNNPPPNLVVTSTGDDAGSAANCTVQMSTTTGTDASCSLRDALLESANLGTTNIYFDSTKFASAQTITLASGLPDFENNLTITGPGAGKLTISGAGKYQIMTMGQITSPLVTISGLTFANGASSGGGGAIYSFQGGRLTLIDCVFLRNSAYSGGAIFNGGHTLTVTGSSFLQNSSTRYGGAINATDLTVANSTFYGNSSYGGGAIYFGGVVTITNNTFDDNSASYLGGAVLDQGELTANNNIFTGNSSENGGAGIFAVSSLSNAAYNVFYKNLTGTSEDDCNRCTSNSNATSAGSNPLTLPLGYYGGTTETYLPQPGSAAICAGSASLASSAGVTTDQRGFALDPTCSAGSVDAGAVQTNQYVVNSLTDSNDASQNCNPSGSGTTCSLRDAIGLANSTPGDITFLSSLTSTSSPGTINLSSSASPAGTGSTLTVSGQVNILGPGANQLTVSGNNDINVGGVFTVNSGATATFYGLTISGGNASDFGGVLNEGTLTMLDSAVSGNTTTVASGIANLGTMTMMDSTISGNTAFSCAGILNEGTLTVTNSTISGNFATADPTRGGGEGGGICSNGTLTLIGSTVSGNTATGYGASNPAQGGGIQNDGTLTLANSIVAENSAVAAGTGGTASNADIYGSYTGAGNGNVADNSSSATSTIDPQLSPLQYNGINATVQTMIPLPGSAAICAGLASNIPSGVTADERGYPLQPANGYCASGTVDAGAVQTNYTAVAFVQQPSNVAVNTDMSPAPTVEVLETDTLLSSNNTDAVGGIPVTLTPSGGTYSSGLSATTSSTSPFLATFSNLSSSTAANNIDLSTSAITVTGTKTLASVTSNSYDVNGPPSFTSAGSTADTAGVALNYPVTTAGGSGTVTLTVSNLSNPIPGVIVPSSGTGTITLSGTPTGAGTETFTITATDSLSETAQQNFTLTVNPAVTFASAGSTTVYVNTALNFSVSTSGGTGAVALAVSNLQNAIPGVVVPSTGTGTLALSGTPTATGAETFTITATDSVGATTVQNFTLTVDPPPNLVVTSAVDSPGVASDCTLQASTTTGRDASCSLRDALAKAASLGTANIYFDSTKFAGATTIALTANSLNIPSYTTIQGPTSGSGATLANLVTIAGNNNPSVPTSDFSVGASVTGAVIANLILTDGNNQGGAISNAGVLTVTGSTISGNNSQYYPGGGIYNTGTLTVSNSTLSGNSASNAGGGILSTGTLTVTNTTFSGNTVSGTVNGDGGGIYVESGTAAVTNSTFSGNSASCAGACSAGGAIDVQSGTLTVANSIFTGNSAGTIAGSGGGIYSDGTANVSYSVFYNNANGDCQFCTSNTHEITRDPSLAALGSYGGPTQTMLPAPRGLGTGGSAICAGALANATAAGIAAGQRGEPFDPLCPSGSVDAGAVQTSYALSFSTGPAATELSGVAFPVVITLTESGNVFTAASEGIAVSLNGGAVLEGDPVYESTSAGVANYTLTIVNPTAVSGLTLSASLLLNSPVTTSINSSSFDLAQSIATSLAPSVTPSSSYVYSQAPPAISVALSPSNVPGVVPADFTATLDGTTSLTVTAGTGTNVVDIALPATPLTVGAHSIVVDFLGVTHYTASTTTISLTVTAPTYEVNTAGDDNPGAASNCTSSPEGACTLRDALAAAAIANGANIAFSSTAFASGAAITLGSGGTLNIPSNTTIQGLTSGSGATLTNLVTVSGGGSSSNFSVFTVNTGVTNAAIDNLTIENGYTSGGGGGINSAGTLTVMASTVSGNTAGNGGGIYSTGALDVVGSTISGNNAYLGGGIYSGGTATIAGSTIASNNVNAGCAGGVSGGGIDNTGTVTITGSTISGNAAQIGGGPGGGGSGGGISNSGTLMLGNSIVAGNSIGDLSCGGPPGSGSNADISGSYTDNGGNQASNNSSATSTINPNLAALGNYGGPTQTMLPLPGSAAICAGLQANISSGVTTDQRGYPNTNTSYSGYTSTPCVDAGAVETGYALNFTVQPPSSAAAGAAIAPAPIVTITESGSPFTAGSTTVSLTDADSDLSASSTTSASTSSGQAGFGNLIFTDPETGDTLTATLALNPAASPAPSATAVSSAFNVTQIGQTITFNPAITSYTYSPSGTFTVSATASSTLAVSFASTTGSICSVSGSTVTMLSAGTCTIEATQTGNADYSAATPVSVNFTINQASQTIAFTPPTSPVTFGVSPISLIATGGASGNAIVFTVVSGPGSIAGSTLTVTGVGTIVVAANQAGNIDYTAAPQVTESIVVNQASLTVTANNATKVYGTPNPAFTGSVTGAVNGDTFTESFATTAGTNSDVGTYAIVPSAMGTDLADYTQIVDDGTLTITPAATATALSLSSASLTPGQSLTLTAQVTSATTGTPTGTVGFYDGATLLNTAALSAGAASYTTASLAPGVTHTLTAVYSGSADFSASTSTSAATVTVAPLDFTMTISGPANQTVVPGSAITYQVTVTPMYGSYAGAVNFAVSGLPPGAKVSFSPSAIAANGGPQTITVTIQTAPATAAVRRPSPPSTGRRVAPLALALLLLFGVGGLRKRGRALRRLLCIVALFIGGALAGSTLSGCGGSGFFAQPPQNYTITVTATSGNLQHSATFTLNLQ